MRNFSLEKHVAVAVDELSLICAGKQEGAGSVIRSPDPCLLILNPGYVYFRKKRSVPRFSSAFSVVWGSFTFARKIIAAMI